MPSIEVSERIIENVAMNRPTPGLMYHRITKTGTLTDLTLYRSVTGGLSGTWYFNVKINGVPLFTGPGRLAFNLGTGSATKTGLSVAVTAGDIVQVDLEQVGGGSILGNLTLITKYAVDDAVVNGPSTATDGAIVLYDGVTGKLLEDSGVTISTDGTLAADSDDLIPTQKAVKTYAGDLLAAMDAVVFKGVIDCSAHPNYPAADAGHLYKISVAGKIGGASGVDVAAGDEVICTVDSTSSGDQATVGANWTTILASAPPIALDGLSDVDTSGVADGDTLVYDLATTTWKPGAPSGGGGSGVVETIVAGTNVTVDDTDPANPIVSASGGGGSTLDSLLNITVPPTLASGTWTAFNSTTATQRGNSISINGPTTSPDRKGLITPLVDKNNFDIKAGIRTNFWDNGSTWPKFGFIFHASGDDGHIYFINITDLHATLSAGYTSAYGFDHSKTALGASYGIDRRHSSMIFFRVVRAGGGSWVFYTSHDGYRWYTAPSSGWSDTFLNNGGSPTHVGVFVDGVDSDALCDIALFSWSYV